METNEGYPDIDLLPKIADIFHVSIDYLLKDHDDFKEIDKLDIVSYIPWVISLIGVLTFYTFSALSIPVLFNFIIYYFIINFSYRFLKQYTDRKNGHTLVKLNTISHFFVCSSLLSQLFYSIYIISITGRFIARTDIDINTLVSGEILFPFVISYLITAVYCFIHYKEHNKQEYCQK